MSSAKRSGSRDISDLKARLGLKKKAAPSAPVPPPAGVVPPPGRSTGAVPVPPGVQPAHPVQPPVPQQVVPDASEDPFGAMNAMAANQAAVASTGPAPIVVVNDGRPVASVEGSSKIARYAKIAGMVLLPLIFGMVIGQIGSKAANYNRTIEDAAKIRVDVNAVGKQLIEIQQIFQVAQDRGKKEGKPWFKLNDEKFTKELEALAPLAPNAEVVFKSFIYDLPPEISEQIFLFYTETVRFQKDLREHIAMSKRDAKAFKEGAEKLQKFGGAAFAGLFEAPTAERAAKGFPATFKLVQLGMPICETNAKPTPTCERLPERFQYRLSETGEFGAKKVVGSDGAISSGNLVLFNPDTPFFLGMVRGGRPTVAEVGYMDRVEALNKKLGDLVNGRKFILDVLNNKAQESTKFTFFM